LLQIQD